MAEPDASMEDAVQVADSEESAPSGSNSFDPQPFRSWVRSILRKLLHQPSPRDPQTLLTSLSEALDQYAAMPSSLSPNHQLLRSLLALYRVSSSVPPGTSGFLTDTTALAACLETHDEATRNSGGSAYSVSAFVRLVSLSISLHVAWEELPLQVDQHESEEDPLLQWTGISGVTLRPDSRYNPAKLPRLPTKASLEQAGEAADLLRKEFEELIGEDATRTRVREAYTRIALHLTESDRVWSLYHDFEIAHLQRSKTEERLEEVRLLYLARLKVPHRTIEETFQTFSTFVSTYLPPDTYESTLSSAQPYFSASLSLWRSRESHEDALAAPNANISTYATWRPYFTHLTRGKAADIDFDFVAALYERCLSAVGGLIPGEPDEEVPPTPDYEAAKAKSKKSLNKDARELKKAEDARERERKANEGEAVWVDYLAFMATSNDAGLLLPLCARANASRPDSGPLWAEHLLHLSRLRRPFSRQEELFSSALSGGMIQSTEGLVRLFLSRIDVEREDAALALVALSPADFAAETPMASLALALARLPESDEAFTKVFGLLEFLISLLHARGKDGQDPLLRLERLAGGWCARRGIGALPLVHNTWETALQLQPLNGHAVIEKARYHTSLGEPEQARALLKGAMGRNGMQPVEEVLREWENFETLWGSARDVMWARNRCRKEREKIWRQWYDSQQMQQQQQQHIAPVAVVDQEMADVSAPGKRKASDDPIEASNARVSASAAISEDTKKTKTTEEKRKTRNREACSVMISGMPSQTTEEEIRHFFRDCGVISLIEGPKIVGDLGDVGDMDVDGDANAAPPSSSAAAMVEFEEQSSVAPARTKDLKRIGATSVRVVPSRECTLYVNNFPPEWTDDQVRATFGRFGDIFGVRWPSLKFDSSRRFCYVTMTTPTGAQACLELHNIEIQGQGAGDGSAPPVYHIEVKFSDPDRKAMRTDANKDQRQLYVKNISPDAEEEEVRAIFEKWGIITRLSMPRINGRLKGLAFVDYQSPLDAQFALGESAGLTIKGKLVSVSLADPNRGRGGSGATSAPGATADARAKSVRIRGLPSDAQEALIQQVVEGVVGQGNVEVVHFTLGESDAVVQVKDTAMAGRLALQQSLQYRGHGLTISPLETRGAAAPIAPAVTNGATSAAALIPRAARRGRGRGRGGGLPRGPIPGTRGPGGGGARDNSGGDSSGSAAGGLGPDAFRDMLKR